MKKLLVLLFLSVSMLNVDAQDTLKITTPVENTCVEVATDGEVVFYIKVANSLYLTDKESYLNVKNLIAKGIYPFVYAVIDDKNQVIKVIYK